MWRNGSAASALNSVLAISPCEALQRRLANYKLPKRVLFVEDLPRNTMGKVQKNVLRETYRDLYADAAPNEPERSNEGPSE